MYNVPGFASSGALAGLRGPQNTARKRAMHIDSPGGSSDERRTT